MALIECKLGPTLQYVQGHPYSFELDIHRRAVCHVYDLVHAKCFLSVEHYREVEAHPAPADPPADPLAETPAPATPAPETPAPDASPTDWQPTSRLILGITPDDATDNNEGKAAEDDGAAPKSEPTQDLAPEAAKPKRTRAPRKTKAE